MSVEPNSGNLWVANLRQSVARYSADGKLLVERPVEALAVQADATGDGAWIVTPADIQRVNSNGDVRQRIGHASQTSEAWIAAFGE